LDTPHSSVRAFAVVASGYWTAPGYRLVAWLLTAGLAATVAANVGIALWLNLWNRDFFNALEKKDLALLFELVWVLAAIVGTAGIAVAVQLHIKRRLQINWRAWLAHITVLRWLNAGRQYQLGCWPRTSTIPTAASPRTSASRPSTPSSSPRASCNASCSSSPSWACSGSCRARCRS
jgi:ABC-type uncharacterized transport system fused permease/ATPase subunit